MNSTTRRRDRVPVLPLYICLLAGVAVWLFVQCLRDFGVQPLGSRWPELLMLVAILCISEMKPISVARSGAVDDIVASTTFAFAIMLTFGPTAAMIAQASASILADARARKAVIKSVFNVSQYAVSWGAAAYAFHLAAPTSDTFVDQSMSGRWILAVAAGGAAYFCVNNTLVGTAIALASGQRLTETVRSTVRSEWTSDVVLLALTPILVIVTDHSLFALPLLLLPIFAVYRSSTISAEKEHLALHDSLTNLPNRFNFSSMLTERISKSRRTAQAAVLLIDLDHFKEINDTLGHQAGDELLRMIGPRIMEALAETSGATARLGGDEFAVLLPDLVDEPEALVIAHRVASALDAPFRLEGFNIEIEASIGVAIYPTDGITDETLMKRADVAMYVAKSRRTVVERYDPHEDRNSTRRLEMVGELRTAISSGEIVLYYQPKLDLSTGTVTDVEALVRWIHPRLGLVSPAEFVPLAEHTGLIRPLTAHLLRTAACQASLWKQAGRPMTVAVNLSARSLHDGAILQEVSSVLADSNLPPSLLRLEITESSIMADPLRARRVLQQLDDMGIRLSIDDFGTGYSSLAYLQDLPVSEIKIDQSFVAHLVERAGDQVIVRSTIDLARNLGLTSVAEGVETAAALDWLTAAGCDHAQGFFIARPMTAAALDEWLDTRAVAITAPHRGGNVVPILAAVHGGSAC